MYTLQNFRKYFRNLHFEKSVMVDEINIRVNLGMCGAFFAWYFQKCMCNPWVGLSKSVILIWYSKYLTTNDILKHAKNLHESHTFNEIYIWNKALFLFQPTRNVLCSKTDRDDNKIKVFQSVSSKSSQTRTFILHCYPTNSLQMQQYIPRKTALHSSFISFIFIVRPSSGAIS